MNVLVDAKHGRMLVNENDIYIGRSVRELGEFSEGEIDLFKQLLRPGCVGVEAGANIGTHTLPLARIVGLGGRIHAFEPQRIVHQTLCANLALNSILNVSAHWAGVSSEPGFLFLPPIDYSAKQNFGGINLREFTEGERVPLVTVDSLNLARLDLLKADVEGMELSVLRGARSTIERCKPTLYIECDRAELAGDLVGYVFSLGYDAYWHQPPLYNPNNFFKNPNNPFGQLISINILAVHRDKRIVVNGLQKVQIQSA